uniref:Major facilitator superfamily (MFS) profile domain-containing protein n=1 Tax=Strigamia maritima TaxID=126957 RepID=T1JCC0_STRMM
MEAANDFEYLLSKAGALGPWQIRLFLFIGLNGFFMAFQHLGSVFLADTPDHWCRLPPAAYASASRANLTLEQTKYIGIPLETWRGKERLSQCTYYQYNFSSFNLSFDDFSLYNRSEPTNYCNEWQFDNSQYISTIVTEWNLVCSWKWLKSTVQASYMAGVLIGCLIFGFISDRFGRRKALLISQALFCISSILASFAPGYVTFIFGRFLTGVSAPGIFGCAFVLITEIVDTKWRAMIGVYYQLPFGIGYATLPAIAYLLRERQELQLALSIPSIVILLSYWVIPESPRWLITKNRFEEALQVLHKCAKTNKRVLPPDNEVMQIMKEMQKKEEASRNQEAAVNRLLLITRLCSTLEMTKRTAAAYFTCPDGMGWGRTQPISSHAKKPVQSGHRTNRIIPCTLNYLLSPDKPIFARTPQVFLHGLVWAQLIVSGLHRFPVGAMSGPHRFVVATVYYGLALNSPTLGGNPYLVVFLGGIFEIPAYLLGSLIISRSGRKITYSITFILAGIACLLITCTPSNITWLISTFAVVGKFFITITFAISYLYTAELFPTVIRNIAVSYGSMVGRVGSISSPYIVYLLGHHNKILPLILFGIGSIIAGLVALVLPETKNTHLVENISEYQQTNKK